MLDATILPRLIDDATRLRRSVKHQELGIAVLYPERSAPSGAAAGDTQELVLTITTAIPDSQQEGILSINASRSPVRPETSLESSIRVLLGGALDASATKGEVAKPLPRLQSVTISVPGQSRLVQARCLGELFWGEGNAVLLGNVLSFLPAAEVLNVTQVSATTLLKSPWLIGLGLRKRRPGG